MPATSLMMIPCPGHYSWSSSPKLLLAQHMIFMQTFIIMYGKVLEHLLVCEGVNCESNKNKKADV